MHDMFLASWVGNDNQIEITLNQFAAQKASSQGVKDFAQKMIRAHQALAAKLNQSMTNPSASTTTGQTPYSTGYRGTENAPETTPQAQSPTPQQAGNALSSQAREGGVPPSTGGAAGEHTGVTVTTPGGMTASVAAHPGSNAIAFQRAIGSQLVARIEQELGQKKGRDFDRCFVQGQIMGHVHMLATLDVARSQASAQLKPVFDEAISTAQEHLNEAQSLAKTLDSQESR
jgi:predicted outer membrane protein